MTAIAIHYQCLTAVQSRLRLINFPAAHDTGGGSDVPLASTSIVVWKTPLLFYRPDVPLPLPAIIVNDQTEEGNATAGVTNRDDWVRPVLVTMGMADNMEATLQVNQDVMAMWRQLVSHAFHNQALAGVAGVWNCSVKPVRAFTPAAWGQQVLASALSLRFISREPRGLNQ